MQHTWAELRVCITYSGWCCAKCQIQSHLPLWTSSSRGLKAGKREDTHTQVVPHRTRKNIFQKRRTGHRLREPMRNPGCHPRMLTLASTGDGKSLKIYGQGHGMTKDVDCFLKFWAAERQASHAELYRQVEAAGPPEHPSPKVIANCYSWAGAKVG